MRISANGQTIRHKRKLGLPRISLLNLDMLSALTEALIVRATGTPMAAVAGMRADMLHERSRRDELEAALIRITERALAPTMTVGRPDDPRP